MPLKWNIIDIEYYLVQLYLGCCTIRRELPFRFKRKAPFIGIVWNNRYLSQVYNAEGTFSKVTIFYRNLYRHKSIPGVDFLVGISRYLSEGQEFREFFTLSGTLSSQASVISDSGIHFNYLLFSLIRLWKDWYSF